MSGPAASDVRRIFDVGEPGTREAALNQRSSGPNGPPGKSYPFSLTSRIGAKGQFVIPKPIRDCAGLRPGDEVEIGLDGDTVRRERQPAGRFAGSGIAQRLPDEHASESVRLDSWAVLAWLDSEELATSRVAAVLPGHPIIRWVNLVEVYDRIERDHGRVGADDTLPGLRSRLPADLPGTHA